MFVFSDIYLVYFVPVNTRVKGALGWVWYECVDKSDFLKNGSKTTGIASMLLR